MLKSFINEYADELKHSEAWKTDPGGEQQKLLGHWTDEYGKDDILRMYRMTPEAAAINAKTPATKAG